MQDELIKVQEKLLEIQGVVEKTYTSMEKMRAYAKWTAIITVALIVLPLLGLVFALPSFMNSLSLPAGF